MDLVKRIEENKKTVMNLSKELGIGSQRFEVKLVLDTSGSMSNAFSNGDVQNIISAVLPIALAFDDDGTVPVYGFANSAYKFSDEVKLNNVDGFVKKLSPKWGGTSYAPAINLIVKDHKADSGGSKGFFGFGKKKSEVKIPTYVIFITDGYNDDVREAQNAMREASEYPIYFMCIGVGGGSFPMLESLDDLSGRKMDNAGYFSAGFTIFSPQSDPQALYKAMIKELPAFCKECLALDLID